MSQIINHTGLWPWNRITHKRHELGATQWKLVTTNASLGFLVGIH